MVFTQPFKALPTDLSSRVSTVSVVLSIRIPRRLKEEMDRLRDLVNWSEEIRAFLEQRVRMYKRIKVLNEVDKALEKLPPTPQGFAASSVRDDRDSG